MVQLQIVPASYERLSHFRNAVHHIIINGKLLNTGLTLLHLHKGLLTEIINKPVLCFFIDTYFEDKQNQELKMFNYVLQMTER